MKKITFAVAGALALGSAPLSAQINIVGSTTGCFYTNGNVCNTGLSTTSHEGLTFEGRNFDVTAGPGGTITFGDMLNSLGRFDLASGVRHDFDDNQHRFRLFVTIASPNTTPGSSNFTARLTGDIRSNGDNIEINFDQEDWNGFSYDGGSFNLRVNNDLDFDYDDPKGGWAYIQGKIDCDIDGKKKQPDIPTCGDEYTPPVTTTPEPSTYVMMAAGLLGVGYVRRRRRTVA